LSQLGQVIEFLYQPAPKAGQGDTQGDRPGERAKINRSADLAGTQVVATTTAQYEPAGQLAYTGREWDPAVGHSFDRARWYAPRAGRFTSEDPQGFAAGDANLTRYVGNAATLWVDPSGMAMSDP
jgi:RHS repeat-associated protein